MHRTLQAELEEERGTSGLLFYLKEQRLPGKRALNIVRKDWAYSLAQPLAAWSPSSNCTTPDFRVCK